MMNIQSSFETAIRKHPPGYLLGRAKNELRRGEVENARKTLHIGLSNHPHYGALWLAMGRLLERHYPDEQNFARKCFERTIQCVPESNPFIMLAASYMRRHEYYDRAETLYAVLYCREENKLRVLNALGNLYRECERHNDAASCYGRAVQLPDADAMVKDNYEGIQLLHGAVYTQRNWEILERRLLKKATHSGFSPENTPPPAHNHS